MGTLMRCGVAGLLLAAVSAVTVPEARASCTSVSGPEGAVVVFVGTAEAERRGYTRLRAEEVWHGPDLAPEVWVLSGQEQPPFLLNLLTGVSSSVDAELVEGSRYVIGASEQFSTSACSIREADRGASLADPNTSCAARGFAERLRPTRTRDAVPLPLNHCGGQVATGRAFPEGRMRRVGRGRGQSGRTSRAVPLSATRVSTTVASSSPLSARRRRSSSGTMSTPRFLMVSRPIPRSRSAAFNAFSL